MNIEELQELFEKHNDRYLKFEEVVSNPRSKRPDLHAFLLLDSLCQGDDDMISASEHDIFYLSVRPEDVCEHITEDQVIELIACGVMYDGEYECFSMFS